MLAQYVNVRQFGAKGDGLSDDTKALSNAVRYAKANKKALSFPKGIYLVNNIDISVNFTGVENQTQIKKINKTGRDDIYTFCNIKNRKNIIIKNLIFDGSVKGTATKPKSGSIPLFIYNASNVSIINCSFINSPAAGLRVEISNNINISQCKTEHLTGAFGDGVYIENSRDIAINNVTSKNYTRIGFVIEKNTRNVKINNCIASYGHDASILYGGTEFNAGFWAESSANVQINNCLSQNNSHYGFVLTSGIDKRLLNTDLATFSISKSKSINNPTAFRVSSSGNPVNINIIQCQAVAANQGFVAFARDKKDKFTFKGCIAEIRESSKESVNDAGFMWESAINTPNDYPVFIYQDCITNFKGETLVNKLYNKATNDADLSTYSGGNANIFIDGMSNNTPSKKPVIKAIKGNPKIEITNTSPNLNYMNRKDQVIIK